MAGSSTNRSPSNTFKNFMCDQHTISDLDFISAFYSPNSVFNTWGSYGNGKRPGA